MQHQEEIIVVEIEDNKNVLVEKKYFNPSIIAGILIMGGSAFFLWGLNYLHNNFQFDFSDI